MVTRWSQKLLKKGHYSRLADGNLRGKWEVAVRSDWELERVESRLIVVTWSFMVTVNFISLGESLVKFIYDFLLSVIETVCLNHIGMMQWGLGLFQHFEPSPIINYIFYMVFRISSVLKSNEALNQHGIRLKSEFLECFNQFPHISNRKVFWRNFW